MLLTAKARHALLIVIFIKLNLTTLRYQHWQKFRIFLKSVFTLLVFLIVFLFYVNTNFVPAKYVQQNGNGEAKICSFTGSERCFEWGPGSAVRVFTHLSVFLSNIFVLVAGF